MEAWHLRVPSDWLQPRRELGCDSDVTGRRRASASGRSAAARVRPGASACRSSVRRPGASTIHATAGADRPAVSIHLANRSAGSADGGVGGIRGGLL